ncbi:MAG: DUF1579 domain-containing protein, partial [Acidobacteria bacterium]|nr:DUF1579 domain-containing protein [Acidobacteriota bacterium]
PEHKRLGAYVGEWSMEGQAKDSPFGPAGTFSGKEKVEWFAGGFFLVSHVQVNGSMGEVKSLSMLGYDPEKKVYSYHSFNSMGMHETATGTVSGDAWTWTNESVMNGKRIQGRYIIKEDSPTAQSFIFEISEAGGPWKTIMEGKSTKTK